MSTRTLPAPRHGDPRLWFTWAIGHFSFLNDAPHPGNFREVADWVGPFDRWCAENLSNTCGWCARFVLGFWNSDHDWQCGRGRSVHAAIGNMDDGNRRAMTSIILGARFF